LYDTVERIFYFQGWLETLFAVKYVIKTAVCIWLATEFKTG